MNLNKLGRATGHTLITGFIAGILISIIMIAVNIATKNEDAVIALGFMAYFCLLAVLMLGAILPTPWQPRWFLRGLNAYARARGLK